MAIDPLTLSSVKRGANLQKARLIFDTEQDCNVKATSKLSIAEVLGLSPDLAVGKSVDIYPSIVLASRDRYYSIAMGASQFSLVKYQEGICGHHGDFIPLPPLEEERIFWSSERGWLEATYELPDINLIVEANNSLRCRPWTSTKVMLGNNGMVL